MNAAVGLMYHDTFANGNTESSGRCGVGPDLYKVDVDRFRGQMLGIHERFQDRAAAANKPGSTTCPLLITFDDGGVSAYTQVASILEEFGLVGHFFVTTSYIGKPGFLDKAQLRELDERGHVVGSHTDSHPDIITNLSYDDLLQEWKVSTAKLREILGKPIEVASIPGGEYSKQVVRAAGENGIRFLFTSEPVTRTWKVGECLAIGRFTIMQTTPDHVVFELANSSHTRSQRQQSRSWYSKKLAKKICGPLYLVIRDKLLSYRNRRQSVG